MKPMMIIAVIGFICVVMALAVYVQIDWEYGSKLSLLRARIAAGLAAGTAIACAIIVIVAISKGTS